jgi:hypothetical protein
MSTPQGPADPPSPLPSRSGTILDEERIAQLLAEVIKHVEYGDLLQAEMILVQRLDFERFLHPIRAEYGTRRVTETGSWIRRCRSAIREGNSEAAFKFAKEAAARWAKP